ncbi:redoxin domain-containing protein [Tropicibacter oceani]|uniref:Redoxin domain-containing protein n=1 Tax=Tropicibacter oceani TaxID=3058420 RepID=A0ABY8QDR5_9RHOB|nr:redoxin domain-containing protein [Tropicibacter oceani]WGW02774.1 redoxin domain-containing protein [Tropicibacter oceani]
MTHPKPRVGAPIGALPLKVAGEDRVITLGTARDRWTMLFVYRGRHCPRCKRFLAKLNKALPAWQEHMDVVVTSADTQDKALADKAEFGWAFDLCHGLTLDQMRDLGLYVSEPLSEAETDAIFAEPGAFAIRPDGTLMLVDISNGPAARPDLDELLDGMIFNITNDRPVRGTA